MHPKRVSTFYQYNVNLCPLSLRPGLPLSTPLHVQSLFQIQIWEERPSEIRRLRRDSFENRMSNLAGRKKIMDAILAGKPLTAEIL